MKNTMRDAMRHGKENEKDPMYLPPRSVIHPSERGKWVKIYVRSLISLFILLVIVLLVWGMNVTGFWHQLFS